MQAWGRARRRLSFLPRGCPRGWPLPACLGAATAAAWTTAAAGPRQQPSPAEQVRQWAGGEELRQPWALCTWQPLQQCPAPSAERGKRGACCSTNVPGAGCGPSGRRAWGKAGMPQPPRGELRGQSCPILQLQSSAGAATPGWRRAAAPHSPFARESQQHLSGAGVQILSGLGRALWLVKSRTVPPLAMLQQRQPRGREAGLTRGRASGAPSDLCAGESCPPVSAFPSPKKERKSGIGARQEMDPAYVFSARIPPGLTLCTRAKPTAQPRGLLLRGAAQRKCWG